MKLPKIRRLMGVLARDVQREQVKELLAVLPSSKFSQSERESCKSAIRFFVLLQKRTGTSEQFLQMLMSLLTECKCQNFLSLIEKFKRENPDLLSEEYPRVQLPNGTGSGFIPKHGQSEEFKRVLFKISQIISKKQLEIMVGLCPTPEAGKENITVGHELFDQMERHGCISENDTEMLQEILELFSLKDAIGHLKNYQKAFPPVFHPPTPSAPIIIPSSSTSMQAQHGSLPQHGTGRQYHPPDQFSHHSLPVSGPGYAQPFSSFGSTSSSGYSRQASSSSSGEPSLIQGTSFLAPMSGGSSFAEVSGSSSTSSPAPVPAHHQESGEENANPGGKRQIVPSQTPPSERAQFGGTVRPFAKVGSGSSVLGHTPSQAGSTPLLSYGGSDVHPRSQRKRGHEQEGGTQPSSGVYPRPLLEGHEKQGFLVGKGQSSRGHEDEGTAPPNKVYRPSGSSLGDDGCVFSTQRRRGPEGMAGNRGGGGGGGVRAAADLSDTDTFSTVSSYAGSEKFETPKQVDPAPHQQQGGGQQSSNSVQSFSAEPNFSAGHQPQSAEFHNPQHMAAPHPHAAPPHAPFVPPHPLVTPPHSHVAPPPHSNVHSSISSSVPSYSAGSLNLPAGHQAQPSLPSLSSASGGVLPSNVSSLPSHRREESLHLPGPVQVQQRSLEVSLGVDAERSQVRSAPGLAVRPTRHPDDLAYLHQHGGPDQQPFLHQGGHSVEVGVGPLSDVPSASAGVGVSMSTLGSYTGPTSGQFTGNVPERSINPMPPRSQGSSLSSPHPSYSSVPKIPPGRKQAMSKETALQAYKAGNFESINEAVNTGTVTGSQPFVTSESHLPGSGHSGRQPPSQAHGQTPTSGVSGASRIEARNVGGATKFVSVSQSIGGTSQLKRHQEQLSSFRQRHPGITEGGQPLAQASSLRNMETQGEGSQEAHHSSSSEDMSTFETAQSGPTPSSAHLYPTLPSLETSNETQPSSAATPTGSKRTRSQDKQLESSTSEEEKQGEGEEESSLAKRQKTSQSDKEVTVKKEKGASKRVTRSKAKKGGILSSLSRAYNYVLGRGSKEDLSSTETEEQSQEEENSNTNTESESEFHDAQEY